MINLNDCVEIGKITRPHGYKGMLILSLNNLSFEDIEEMELVFVLIDGLPVPFFISDFSERSKDSLLVNLEGVDSIESVRELSQQSVFVHKAVLKKNELKLDLTRIIGYKVIDVSKGTIGYLDSIIQNTKNPLFRILSNKDEILIPFQDEFIVEIKDETKEIILNCPVGLLDIY